MQKIDTNDWMILNRIIYMINTTESLNEMRYELMNQLKMVIDFDSALFYVATADGEKQPDNIVTYDCDADYIKNYKITNINQEIIDSGRTLIYRETDMISDEERVNTEYYQKLYRPNKWHYSLQIIISRNKKFLGLITFYRTIGKEDFSYDDIFVLDVLKDHLAYRLEQLINNAQNQSDKYTIEEATEKYQLTKRESAVLSMLMSGSSNDVACEELGISPNTLKKHVLNIYRKLGIRNRVQLFKMIRERS